VVYLVGRSRPVLGAGLRLAASAPRRSRRSSGCCPGGCCSTCLHKPAWLWAWAAWSSASCWAELALQLASVALVEPLLSASLLFAFVIAAVLSDRKVRWHEVGGARC